MQHLTVSTEVIMSAIYLIPVNYLHVMSQRVTANMGNDVRHVADYMRSTSATIRTEEELHLNFDLKHGIR
jgi:hypothetical protein